MARQKRFDVAGITQHIIQRGNNRSDIFSSTADLKFFLSQLAVAAENHDLQIHAYVCMTNHIHLLATPATNGAIGKTMQSLGRRYVQYFNQRHGRTGTLWEGRYRSTAIDTEHYLFYCYRYIELNPVRAGMVENPSQYRWSSDSYNANGKSDKLVTPHSLYCHLGKTSHKRRYSYRHLFREELSETTIEMLRDRTNKAWVLGGKTFCREIEALVGRPAETKPRGGDRRSRVFKSGQTNRV